jgi:predicted nucleotidyltransferase
MDIESLLKSLNARNVEYVIIGASAFPIHGYARATLDLDLFIRPTQANAERTWQALKAFGYDMADITIGEMLSKKLLIRQYILETDIHPFAEGITFEEVWKNKVAGTIGSTSAYFASLNDLIVMKKAAGRGKDKEDLKVLMKLKERAGKGTT